MDPARREGSGWVRVLLLSMAVGLPGLTRPLVADDWRVVTLAGNGRAEYTGDGGSAREAGVSGPFGVVGHPNGGLYVCEIGSHLVRRIDLETGRISTMAGTGRKGYEGDGGPATKALCNEPYEVRFDEQAMYFVEMQNHLIRRVSLGDGTIDTLAGEGKPGFSGDGGPARAARFKSPHSIALDGRGGLFVADIGNHRIRRVDLKTGIIETVAGTGARARTADGAPVPGSALDGPRAIDFSTGNTMWLALREGNAVYRVDWTESRLWHVAGTGKSGYTGDGGPARVAQLAGPKGIAVGPGGWVYIADTESHTIRRIQTQSGQIETLVGDGRAGDGPDGDPRQCRLDRPHGVWVDGQGRVYIGDSSNNRVRVALPPGVEVPPAVR